MSDWFHIAISNALVASIPAIAAMLLSRGGRRPAVVHALWILALLKLVTPPVFDVRLPLLPPVAGTAILASNAPEHESAGPQFSTSIAIAANTTNHAGAVMRAQKPVPWSMLVAGVWVGGAVVVMLLTAVRLLRFNRVLQHARRVDGATMALARQVAGRLGMERLPAIEFVPGRLPPMLWAMGRRPALFLPLDLWRDLTQDKRTVLLAHELAHLKRGDHWVRFLELLAGVVWWWHPLVWLGRGALREVEEQCCDAWVVQAYPELAREYACALVDTLDFVSQSRLGLPLLASGASSAKNHERRLTMIMKITTPGKLSPIAKITVMGMGLLLLPALPKLAAWGDEPGRKETPKAAAPAKEGRAISGTFAGMNRNAIIVSDDERDRDQNIELVGGAKVTLDGAAARLPDLRPGMVVSVRELEGGGFAIEAKRPRWMKQAPAGGKEVGRPEGVRREGDGPRPGGPRDGDGPKPGGLRDGEGPRPVGPRDGDGPKPGGLRDGDGPQPGGPRDGDGPKPGGLRDGDGPRPVGPRDGDAPKPGGLRDGEGPKLREGAPRDGVPRIREGDRPKGEGPREGAPRVKEGERLDVEGARRIREGDRPKPEGLREGAPRPKEGERVGPREGGDGPPRIKEGERVVEGVFGNPGREPARGVVSRGTFDRLEEGGIVIRTGEGGKEQNIGFGREARLFLNGEPAKLSDLKPGMILSIKQTEGKPTEIEARPARR